MSVNIAGIMGTIALAGLAYGLINAGGTRIHEAVGALREKRVTTLKKRYTRAENAGKYWLCTLGNFVFGLLLCFIAGAIVYVLLFSPAASALR